ncbi:MAG: hypothetical protein MK074_06355 [Phycisphaerales bacterium]|nr:hypothetical protein [Phycisphaerales bacterium]
MKQKLLVSVCVLVLIALTLLSFRQARIMQVNRMNRAWNTLQHEREQWQQLRLKLATAGRPDVARPAGADEWSSATELHADSTAP